MDIKEALNLLKVGSKLVPHYILTNEYVEIWNNKRIQKSNVDKAITIFDNTAASLAGWGVYEGFARTYSLTVFKTRIIDNFSSNCYAKIYKVIVGAKPVPDLKKIIINLFSMLK
ncbi:MAG: hypothetical protein RMY16_19270 [Nostoc sp. DedQUE12b]|uniref:hypothetical protein n=1 Tax=Nostoc sp. DedQUE12b TaxID=3075398 RepID=UPI002AD2DE01|nr:hypothetical protein [Nostoc sp. DedQUE12b]MDZ8087684.1 hypothetical protein [Nostoc sp. DedQUE12b]